MLKSGIWNASSSVNAVGCGVPICCTNPRNASNPAEFGTNLDAPEPKLAETGQIRPDFGPSLDNVGPNLAESRQNRTMPVEPLPILGTSSPNSTKVRRFRPHFWQSQPGSRQIWAMSTAVGPMWQTQAKFGQTTSWVSSQSLPNLADVWSSSASIWQSSTKIGQVLATIGQNVAQIDQVCSKLLNVWHKSAKPCLKSASCSNWKGVGQIWPDSPKFSQSWPILAEFGSYLGSRSDRSTPAGQLRRPPRSPGATFEDAWRACLPQGSDDLASAGPLSHPQMAQHDRGIVHAAQPAP